MALSKRQRDLINQRLGMARALQATNPEAAQNYARAAVSIAARGGNASQEAAVNRAANAIARPQVTVPAAPTPEAPPPPPPPPPPGGGTDPLQGEIDALKGQIAALLAAQQQRESQEREAAKSFLTGVLREYNMDSLVDQVDQLVRTWGRNTTVIAEKLKQTEEYKTRFKGLLGLQQRGITDIRNEAEYLNLETQYRQVFREAGLRDYLGTSGTQSEYDSIASLVSDFSLSVNEVRDRVTDAQRVVAETPQEVRDSLQQFYGIDPALLTQYVLDPENTTTQIQRRANAAIVGGYAQRAGLTFGAGVSERIGEFVGGGEDIRGTAIEPILTEVSDIQKATRRLADIEKTTLTEEETALSRLDLDQEAREKVRGLQSRERARFSGRSAIRSAALKRPRSI